MISRKAHVATFLIKKLCSKTLVLLISESTNIYENKGSFIQNLCLQEKLWNHQCYSMLRKTGQKSSHYVYLCRLGWKNLHIKAGWKSSRLFFHLFYRFLSKQPLYDIFRWQWKTLLTFFNNELSLRPCSRLKGLFSCKFFIDIIDA